MGAIVGAAGLVGAGYFWGQDSLKADQSDQEIQIRIVEKEVIKEVIKVQIKREVKYRDKIKTVYKLPDPTGCLDTSLGTLKLLQRPATNTGEPSVISSSTKEQPNSG